MSKQIFGNSFWKTKNVFLELQIGLYVLIYIQKWIENTVLIHMRSLPPTQVGGVSFKFTRLVCIKNIVGKSNLIYLLLLLIPWHRRIT